jgi:hypothetical protein
MIVGGAKMSKRLEKSLKVKTDIRNLRYDRDNHPYRSKKVGDKAFSLYLIQISKR